MWNRDIHGYYVMINVCDLSILLTEMENWMFIRCTWIITCVRRHVCVSIFLSLCRWCDFREMAHFGRCQAFLLVHVSLTGGRPFYTSKTTWIQMKLYVQTQNVPKNTQSHTIQVKWLPCYFSVFSHLLVYIYGFAIVHRRTSYCFFDSSLQSKDPHRFIRCSFNLCWMHNSCAR